MTRKPEADSRTFPGQPARALHLFTLAQLAVAYPVYELLARYPEFFVARQSQPVDIILLVFFLSGFLPLALYGLQALLSHLDGRLGRWTHLLLVAVLLLCMGLAISAKFTQGAAHLAAGVLFSLLLTVAYARTSVLRLFMSFLSPAILLAPAIFLVNADVKELLQAGDRIPKAGQTTTVATVPLVFVVFDELPTYALLDDSGDIDQGLFPNFHALAATSYWFPYATTVATSTVLAIPPILTGRYPTEFVMPHHGSYPDNLFTWLAGDYDLNVREAVSVMCPQDLCGAGRSPRAGERWRKLLLDVTAVHLNIIAPAWAAGRLPAVTRTWGDFWDGTEAGPGIYEHRLRQLDEFVAELRHGAKPGLDFIHANFPHIPYEYLPSGKRYQEGWLLPGLDVTSDSWTGTERQSAEAYRRFRLQLQALDRWLGTLIDRLKSEDLFDRTLIVITADHGVSFTPGSSRRDASPKENLDESILPVPLIIKAPRQRQPVRSERNAETVDILPTLAELLGRPLTWKADGVSLLGDPKPLEKRALHSYKALEDHRTGTGQVAAGIGRAWESNREPFESQGLYRDLIGSNAADLPRRRDKDFNIQVDHTRLFEQVDPSSGFLPAHVTGIIEGSGPKAPDLAISLNGRIGAVTTAFTESGVLRFSAMLPEAAFRSGPNDLRVFGLETGTQGRALLVEGGQGTESGDYSLDSGGLAPSDAEGLLTIDEPGIDGAVDYISPGDEAVEILGWAIDSANSQAVQYILVFDGDEPVYQGGTPMLREETHRFGVVVEVGFHAVIPFGLLADSSGAGLRVFAVSFDRRARELPLK